MHCKICHGHSIIHYFTLNDVPVANNVLCKTLSEAQSFPVGDIQLWGCESCGFSWNETYAPDLLKYNAQYENNQTTSSIFKKHMEIVIDTIDRINSDSQLLEVGCGQGDFLSLWLEKQKNSAAFAIGFDPAVRNEQKSKHLELHSEFLKSTKLGPCFIPTKAITRHVIEHIPNPDEFIKNIINASVATLKDIFIETPSLEWILSNNAYYDIYYEHCSLFSKPALHNVLAQNQFGDVEVYSMFGGQYYLAAGRRSPSNKLLKGRFPFAGFQKGYNLFIKKWTSKVESLLAERKRLAIWGAASKGITLLQRLGAAGRKIPYVVDINPKKQGGYLPGTEALVLSPNEAFSEEISAYIVANPLYMDEVRSLCTLHGIKAHLVPLV